MAFLVRKLNKMDRLSVLTETPDVNKLSADIPTTEFRTTEGSLSTWIIESLDKINEAVLAIAITSILNYLYIQFCQNNTAKLIKFHFNRTILVEIFVQFLRTPYLTSS